MGSYGRILLAELFKDVKEWLNFFSRCFSLLHAVELAIKKLIIESGSGNMGVPKHHRLYNLYKHISSRYRRWISMFFPNIEEVLRIAQEKQIYHGSRGYSPQGGISYPPEAREFCEKYVDVLEEFINFMNVMSRAISTHQGEKIMVIYYVYEKLREEYPPEEYLDLEVKLGDDLQKLRVISRNELLLSTIETTIKRLLIDAKKKLYYRVFFPIKRESKNLGYKLLLELP